MNKKSFYIPYQILILTLIGIISIMYLPFLILVPIVLALIVPIWALIGYLNYSSDMRGYGVVFGGLGSGKTTTASLLATRGKVYSNVPYPNSEDFNLVTYLRESVGQNTSLKALDGTFERTEKVIKYEGSTIIYDDLALYLPNYMDSELKKKYPQLGLQFPIRRHLYNHPYFVMTIQDIDRLYKVARELQIDYYIKAVAVNNRAWRLIPVLGFFPKLNYIYYSNYESARMGKLPYKEVAILDKAMSTVHVGAGRALEKVYNAENGIIRRRAILLLPNKKRSFDSRYFHEKIFGYPSYQDIVLEKNIERKV